MDIFLTLCLLWYNVGYGFHQFDDADFGVVKMYPSKSGNPQDREQNCTSDIMIIDKLLNGTGYNKFKVPKQTGVDVAVEFWLQAITSIDEITNDFELDMYINEVWVDPALNFEHLSPCKQNLSISHQVLEKLWTPNSCFINSKVADIHNSPFRNVFLMLYPNGTVWVNYRVRVKGPCNMELSNFPMDTQTCHLVYESFNYNNQEVRMRWNPMNGNPVYAIGSILLPDFDLIRIEAELKVEPYPAGMWDELHVRLSFGRRSVWYFMQAYVPSYLTICISWVSFSLGSKAIPARTMLGVNALLAMIFQFGNIMRNLPRVSYIKAIDVWMLGAMTFIFLSLLELAVIGYLVRDEGGIKKRPVMCKKRLSESPPNSPRGICGYEKRFMFPVQKCELAWTQRTVLWLPKLSFKPWTPNEIDKFCSIAFPACFALFNIAYYSYYLTRAGISRDV
ncbi:unnamed protein product [Bursaphelenchus okinawaensis]|uniref:Uncharacterized protein n=1 Tax=Bursaphelenchus okinawaensis TaxID=465554 RepID=A0A811L982_9BILA|nr:unnamed protein product [Bursaphelenchus okinawaensis]CAG9120086.1 unnamed protein product [Bursaphelenchus okinawaensis]